LAAKFLTLNWFAVMPDHQLGNWSDHKPPPVGLNLFIIKGIAPENIALREHLTGQFLPYAFYACCLASYCCAFSRNCHVASDLIMDSSSPFKFSGISEKGVMNMSFSCKRVV